MFKTRIQTTEVRVGDKTCYGPPDLVPVHPLGDPTPNYKMMDYKFMVFEKHDLYDSGLSPADEAVYNFVKISLHYVAQASGEFESDGERTVRFTDRSGRKNAKMVLMVGVFTPEMIDAIRDGLKEPYKAVDDDMFVCGKCMGPVSP